MKIATAFFAASRNGDMGQLKLLLAADVVTYSDGGGKVRAGIAPVIGLDAVMELHASLASIYSAAPSRILRYGLINGLPGFVTIEEGATLQTTALQIEDDKISGIYVVRNPDKLGHLDRANLP